MRNSSKKVFVAMSGGVDSSVAAALLKERGFDVTGVYIKCYNLDGCSERDAEDARRVAGQLNIPFYTFDLEHEYKDRVVKYMIDGYRKGITPNPDVMCNKEIKFGLFFKKARSLGADYIATGHYVRLSHNLKHIAHNKKANASCSMLRVARDYNKDQSYFLWTLTQSQLKHCLFPIGDFKKPEIRKLAKKFGLITADKKDSQGICFLGKISILDFLKKYIPEKPGDILNTDGRVIGRHRGAQFYTIGQRHGLGLSGGGPYYVAGKNTKKNIITVAEGDKASELYAKEVYLNDINLIQPKIRNSSLIIPVFARVRYRQPLAKAKLFKEKRSWKLVFAKPVKYAAPGQSAVFYNSRGVMLGGGVIL